MSTLHGSMSVGGSFSNKVCVYLTWMSLLDDGVFPYLTCFVAQGSSHRDTANTRYPAGIQHFAVQQKADAYSSVPE